MTSLANNVSRWLGRVELVARGADEERREAERWLAKDNPLQARAHALALLSKVPGSPIGLALLVDACDAAGLDDEAVDALRLLCASAPWRGELWVRLGQALGRAAAPVSDRASAFQRALDPSMDPASRRTALLELADLDLARGDPWRAMRWLDAMRLQSAQVDVALRNLEVGLAVGDRALVEASFAAVGQPDPLDARTTLACARASVLLADPFAIDLLLRAFILEAPGACQALSSFVSGCRDAAHVARVRAVLEADHKAQDPVFALSIAMAEGRNDDAQRALLEIARTGDITAARSLYEIAVERRDRKALRAALDVLAGLAPSEGVVLLKACEQLACSRYDQVLEGLDALCSADSAVRAWAHVLRVQVYRLWDAAGDAGWARLLTALRRLAAAWDRLDLMAKCEALSIERQRPLRVAVVGEFNAGKSTFINALIGADVAPTGVLPTTATLHWLAWAPDPFARIVLCTGPDRIVTHDALKAALCEIASAGQGVPRQVDICAPIERLKRIELLDTPGFNSPDEQHARAARRALEEAHVVLWVFDATQPLKDSERRVLATIAELGVPLQALVNKSDRVSPAELARVIAHVASGLDAIGTGSIAAVTPLSARLALAGRLGDSDAFARSGWNDVEQLLSASLVNRSEQLRAAAVKRKACLIARELQRLAVGQAAGGRDTPESQHCGREHAALVAGLDQEACELIVAQLAHAAEQLDEDLRPVRLGSIPDDDPQARAYAEARVIARLADPLAHAIAQAVFLQEPAASLLREPVAQVLRGVAASDPYSRLGWRAVHACAGAAAEVLLRSSRPGAEADDDLLRAARLAALAESLS